MHLQHFSKGTVQSELCNQMILEKKDVSFKSEDSSSSYIPLRLQNTTKHLLII